MPPPGRRAWSEEGDAVAADAEQWRV